MLPGSGEPGYFVAATEVECINDTEKTTTKITEYIKK
jgi:hypothetical protein